MPVGGAGTWSDGKLTTRIGRNDSPVQTVLQTLCRFGAPSSILVNGKVQHTVASKEANLRVRLPVSTVQHGKAPAAGSTGSLQNWHVTPWCSVLQPHLGTDRLIGILRAFRAQLLALGVNIRWGSAVHSLDITAQGSIAGVHLEGSPHGSDAGVDEPGCTCKW